MVRQAGGNEQKNRFLQLTNVSHARDGDDSAQAIPNGQSESSSHIPVSLV